MDTETPISEIETINLIEQIRRDEEKKERWSESDKEADRVTLGIVLKGEQIFDLNEKTDLPSRIRLGWLTKTAHLAGESIGFPEQQIENNLNMGAAFAGRRNRYKEMTGRNPINEIAAWNAFSKISSPGE